MVQSFMQLLSRARPIPPAHLMEAGAPDAAPAQAPDPAQAAGAAPNVATDTANAPGAAQTAANAKAMPLLEARLQLAGTRQARPLLSSI